MCEWEPQWNLSNKTFYLHVSKQRGTFARPFCTCAPTHVQHTICCTVWGCHTSVSIDSSFLGCLDVSIFQLQNLHREKGKAVPVQAMKIHGWNGSMVPLILNLDTTYRWSISGPGRFTPRKGPRYVLKWKFCGLSSLSGWFWRREDLSYLPVFDPWAF